MDPASLSVFVFGIYIGIMGIAFLVVPDVPLASLRFKPTQEEWLRGLGVVLVGLGFTYIYCALNDQRAFYWATVFTRYWALVAFAVLAAIRAFKPQIIVFGIIDAAFATWTLIVLL